MSNSSLVDGPEAAVPVSYLAGAVVSATALGALIAYLAGKSSQDDDQPGSLPKLGMTPRAGSQQDKIRDRSEGKHCGKQVSLMQRKLSRVFSTESLPLIEETKEQSETLQEMLATELKRHKVQQKK